MNIWKRNAVVATVVLFVSVALYLSWSYSRSEEVMANQDGEMVYTVTGTEDAVESGVLPEQSLSNVLSEEQTELPDAQNSYFTEQRLSRQKARDSALTILKDLASQDTLSEDERKQANSEISGLATQALTEAKVEGLVVSKGFADCVVYISESGVNVIVAPPADGLTATDVVRIQDIVLGETSFSTPDIRIVEASAG